jgi:hypothetical protein
VKSLLNSSFGSKEILHSFYCCADKNCTNISKDETVRIKAKDKFQHAWIFDGKLTYCDKTGYHWLVYEEGKGMFCILCRKHDTANPQNKTKKFNMDALVRYKRKTVEEHARSAQHMASIELNFLVEFQLSRRKSTGENKSEKMSIITPSFLCIGLLNKSFPTASIHVFFNFWKNLISQISNDFNIDRQARYVKCFFFLDKQLKRKS